MNSMQSKQPRREGGSKERTSLRRYDGEWEWRGDPCYRLAPPPLKGTIRRGRERAW
ncbi:hypothetical protein BD414DRAFT_490303 [Trametes punicea]|nr:hypothetical protein BD414DRAFT_490303 [Trametes punicea]